MIRKERLPNGVRIVTESMPHVRSVAVGVWLDRGSRHEPAGLHGASHFIEHLVFKGTASRSARQIAFEIDSVGGYLDAFTTKESTCFHAKVLDVHLPVAVDLLADLVLHPRFDPEELERERQVVVEEIRMVEDTPEELVHDLLASHVYRGHPLARPIQGTERSIGAMSRRRLLGYFQGAYRPQELLVAAAGHLRHDAVARLVRATFGRIPRARGRRRPTAPPRARGGIIRAAKRGLEQVHLVLGVPALPEAHAARHRLLVLNAVLGGTTSSRLFQKVREARGLAYAVESSVQSYHDAGQLVVYAATSPGRTREALRVILDEMRDLKERGPSLEELRVARSHLEGSLLLSQESTSSRMWSLARQEIVHGAQATVAETLRDLAKVTPRGVRDVARVLFRDRGLGLAAVGRPGGLRVPRGGLSL